MNQSTLSKEALTYFEEREKLCELCRKFYEKGWASGTGGGMTIKVAGDIALIAPSGVQKEELQPSDLFAVKLNASLNHGCEIIDKPENLKISACTSIFTNIFNLKASAASIIHSHSVNAVMLTKITKAQELTISGYEMLKGIEGCTYFSSHTIPILDNVEHECDLAEDIGKVILQYPKAYAVLVRDHGFYVWGKSWQQAKIHAECYDYLFGAIVQEKSLQALSLI
ncbi:MAG: methylthioribulose 1-phosphate dehydratase [Candidatus Melainabacteria bacterium]|jgi:methylthioribulose-1-phosphate dehydratase